MSVRKTGFVVLAVPVCLVLFACKDEPREAPHVTYERYNQLVIDGRSFAEDVVFHAKARREEIGSDTKRRAKAAGKSIDEYQKLYLSFTQNLARCAKLTLQKEEVNGDKALVVFDVEDTCTDAEAEINLTVEMVYEDGWTIQSDTMSSKSK